MLTVRRILGGVHLVWRDLLFLAMLTPATPILVEFFGEKRTELVLGITFATGNHLARNFGRFWVFSAFWSEWNRLQSQQRCRSAIFKSEELEEPSGP
jgi:hypothetical protein